MKPGAWVVLGLAVAIGLAYGTATAPKSPARNAPAPAPTPATQSAVKADEERDRENAAQTLREILKPAPAGEPTMVAQKIILDNFDPEDCPLVVDARRLGDGSIKALCNNGETFRIMGPRLAMRCSVALKIGVKSC